MTTGAKVATVAIQSPKGATPWVDLHEILAADGVGTIPDIFVTHADERWIIKYIHLIIDGVVQTANNKGNNTNLAADYPTDYLFDLTVGGTTDTWGATLTPEVINDIDFGVAVALAKKNTSTLVETDVTYYIKVSKFDFGIPDDATIDGIQVRMYGGVLPSTGTTDYLILDFIAPTIHFTWDIQVPAQGSSSGGVYTSLLQENIAYPNKKHRFLVSAPDGEFLGDWDNWADPPTFKREINNLHSAMDVTLAQNEQTVTKRVENLLTEGDENIVSETDEDLLIDLATPLGVGTGTSVEVNNEVDLMSYYGALVELLTEDDEPLLTEDFELIFVEDGAPHGKKIFSGYIPEFELNFGSSDDVTVPLLTHSQELNNIPLETDDILKITSGSFTENWYFSLRESHAGGRQRLFQTFTQVGTVPINRIRLKGWNQNLSTSIPITITLVTGTAPDTPGTTLATATTVLQGGAENYYVVKDIDFIFPQVNLTNGTVYGFFVDVPTWATGPTSGNGPASIISGNIEYASGGLKIQLDPTSPFWVDATGPVGQLVDLYFQVYQPAGFNEVTFNSMDPSDIWRAIIDFGRSRGARANYTADSVEDTGTTVSVTLKGNTVAEALAAVLKLCPSDWYMYYDFGDNILHLHPRPTEPAHIWTKGNEVTLLRIKRSIIELVNDVLFSGGGTPALYIRRSDSTSITQWRRGLARINDSRVIVQATAIILVQAKIDRQSQPVHSGPLEIYEDGNFFVEDVDIGELSGFAGFGEFVDLLQLQHASITYHPEYLNIDLSTLLPKIPKRIEDIKRNLNQLESDNNPDSPTVV